MRFFPVLTAILVCVALFFVVLQREVLFERAAMLTGDMDAPALAAAAAEDVPADTGPRAIATTQAADKGAVHVVALRSQAQDVPDAIMVRGQTEAAREVTLTAETSGTVISKPIRRGALVEEGQVLCELDPGTSFADLSEAEARLAEARARVPEAQARVPEAEARLAEAQALRDEARINQNAASRLSEEGFASQSRLAGTEAALRAAEASVTSAQVGLETTQAGIESAQAGIEAAAAAVERARLMIRKLTIKAPFSGLLETDTAEIGRLLSQGQGECATIVQLDPIRLVGYLPEAQVDDVRVGAAARAQLASGREVVGEVTFVSRAADELTRTFRVDVTVPNADLSIRDGQTAEIIIATEPTEAHLVPASALTLDDDGRLGVRVVDDGIAGFAPVELIRDTVDGVLLGGLPENVAIITVGQEYVTAGVPVRVTYQSEIGQ
ncbi:Multidrug transporter MdtA [Jannaschia seosinensis]|uniref:Multidrug transporter MdtA n=1 Tax=Jannaschia seosinensis TaxID=313367 RepID=A0A0M7B8I2_9RHOB|nr:efflux RND transporter periplasmic adaptor subunit [Jannaschia seosinensis]CUH28929.1 Multidrug transporter MdtA [Jannaschia seosinensis]